MRVTCGKRTHKFRQDVGGGRCTGLHGLLKEECSFMCLHVHAYMYMRIYKYAHYLMLLEFDPIQSQAILH